VSQEKGFLDIFETLEDPRLTRNRYGMPIAPVCIPPCNKAPNRLCKREGAFIRLTLRRYVSGER